MRTTFALLALVGASVAAPEPQGVTGSISPKGSPPPGCSSSYDGKFEITVVKPAASKRDLSKRAECGGEGTLVLSLAGGKLTDGRDRTGYIASNFQFQFDGPPQAGAIYTSGFSACSNGSIALGSSTVFWQCLSGDFYNLYDRKWAAQCNPVEMLQVPCGKNASPPPPVTPVPAGPSSAPAAGGSTPAPVTTAAPASSAASQLPDGQPQASSAVPISQISDGQPQASSAIPISELSDGQPNVPTPLVSQIGDGQPQATSAAPIPVSQISDGQPQAGNATVAPSPSITPFTGAAALPTAVAEFVALAAGVAAVAML